MDKVGVVILNYKVKDKVIACVKSVISSDYKNLAIVVVDNDSDDGIEDEIHKYKVEFIQTGKNLGYTGGNNKGIKKLLEEKADWIFILNPDARIKETTISNLLKVMKVNEAQIGGPKIYFSGSKKIWYAGGRLDLANVLGSHVGVDEEDKGQFERIEVTDFVTGAALFVKSEVFKQIGLFDERYFLYLEDLDFCYRAKIKDMRVLYIPSAVAEHDNAASTGLGSPIQDYYITRNRMLFANKFLSMRTQFALIREAFRNILNKYRRKALLDYLLGNFGKAQL